MFSQSLSLLHNVHILTYLFSRTTIKLNSNYVLVIVFQGCLVKGSIQGGEKLKIYLYKYNHWGCYMFEFYIKESSEFYKVTVKKVDVKIGWCDFL